MNPAGTTLTQTILVQPPSPTGRYQFRAVSDIDQGQLSDFLNRQFGLKKGDFLTKHGRWWHQGDDNRFVLSDEAGVIGAYYTTTPIKCLVNGQRFDTLWWIDLIVDQAHRRQGLQRMMDDEVRGRPHLKLGIPNGPHAKILARHGWHVRDDLRKYLLPLRPHRLPHIRKTAGLKRALLAGLGWGVALPATLLRLWLANYRAKNAWDTPTPSAARLAAIFQRFQPENMVTTYRDTSFLKWRYLDAPYRAKLSFYLAGPRQNPTHYLIAHHVTISGIETTRILDIFGDFDDTAALRDIVRLAVRDAVRRGSSQVTAMAAMPELLRVLRSIGFWPSIPVHFCYHDPNPAVLEAIDNGLCYWTIGDSDIDDISS